MVWLAARDKSTGWHSLLGLRRAESLGVQTITFLPSNKSNTHASHDNQTTLLFLYQPLLQLH